MAPEPPTLGSAPAQPRRSSITVVARPRNGPHTPNARKRPGAAAALLDYRRRAAPKWPPHPQRSEAPRRSRGAPRLRASGPEMALKPKRDYDFAMARAIFSGVIGSSVRRTPAASSMALARAAGAGTMGGSPTPRAPNGPAGDGFSRMMHSMFGRSAAVSFR